MSDLPDKSVIQLPNKDLLLPREVAPILRISKATIYRWCDLGILTCIKIRGTRRIYTESVKKRIEEAIND
jgi:excisionase family DNA binding protein